jgi:hypothetical protein
MRRGLELLAHKNRGAEYDLAPSMLPHTTFVADSKQDSGFL